MKVLKIFGKDYCGKYSKSRIACRGLVIKEDKLLLTYENTTNQWMLPGGGLEANESEIKCCIREIAEETGYKVNPINCFLEIDEFYNNFKWVNKYYVCNIVGNSQIRLTEREKSLGVEHRWLPFSDIKTIFSEYESYENKDIMRYGMYYREYMALSEFEKIR